MADLRTAAQQALEALEKCKAALAEELAAWDIDPPLRHVLQASNSCGPSIAALRAALAEPETPIWQTLAEIGASAPAGTWDAPVATPPARQPLTDEEIDAATAREADALLDHIYEYGTTAEGVRQRIRKLARAIERAHGIE